MGADDLLRDLRSAGIEVSVRGDSLIAKPASRLTEELRAALRANKPAILAEIVSGAAPVTRLTSARTDVVAAPPSEIDPLPNLRPPVLDHRQDLGIESADAGVHADDRESLEERAAVIAADGECARQDAENAALKGLRAAQRAKLPRLVEADLARLLDSWKVSAGERDDYRRDLIEHAARDGWAAAHDWLRRALRDVSAP